MALTAADKAQRTVDNINTKIDALEQRKTEAVAKVEAKYADDLVALKAERDHAQSHPALQTAVESAPEPA